MYRNELRVTTAREGEIINITEDVQNVVSAGGIRDGLVHLFVQHSTAALTTIEYEKGVLADLQRALSVIAPDDIPFAHNTKWGNGNGRSHVKAALVGPDLTVPVADGELLLGTWQQIALLELDIHGGRNRTVVVTVSG